MPLKNPSKALFLPLVLVCGGLSGCVSVLPEAQQPQALIRLPAEGVRAAKTPLAADVIVHRPDALGAVAGVDIATADNQRIRYLSEVKWADSPMRLLQEALVDSLLSSNGEGRAAPEQTGIRGDYEIRWTIRDLTVNDALNEAVCDVRVVVTRLRGREIVTAAEIRGVEPLNSTLGIERAEALARAVQSAAELTADFVAKRAIPYDLNAEREAAREERRARRDERRQNEGEGQDELPESETEEMTTPQEVSL